MPDASVWQPATSAEPAPPAAVARLLNRVRQLDPLFVACAMLAVMLVAAATFAPWIAPYDPDGQRLLARLRPPLGFEGAIPDYLLGTDQLGRDLLSRCLHGLRLSLILAVSGAVAGLLFGAAVGFVAGLAGGIVDSVAMAVADVKLSLPVALVALFVIALAGSDIAVLVLVLGLAYWAHFARLVRAQVMSLRELPYVEAARAAGATDWRIATRHLLPNIVSPVVVMFTLCISNLILLESALSFLGLGVQPPTATLGSMVGQGRDYMASAPWIVASPALLIVLVSLVVMLLGDALRDRLDVKLRER
jgi:peptide/nickel transport system permease protein